MSSVVNLHVKYIMFGYGKSFIESLSTYMAKPGLAGADADSNLIGLDLDSGEKPK